MADLASVGVEMSLKKGWRKRWMKQLSLDPQIRHKQERPAAKVVHLPGPPIKRRIEMFYRSYEWADARYNALKRSNGCCELCGRGKADGVVLNVDHIKPLKRHWELRIELGNLQVLCALCNKGKGNRDETDWRDNYPDLDAEWRSKL